MRLPGICGPRISRVFPAPPIRLFLLRSLPFSTFANTNLLSCPANLSVAPCTVPCHPVSWPPLLRPSGLAGRLPGHGSGLRPGLRPRLRLRLRLISARHVSSHTRLRSPASMSTPSPRPWLPARPRPSMTCSRPCHHTCSTSASPTICRPNAAPCSLQTRRFHCPPFLLLSPTATISSTSRSRNRPPCSWPTAPTPTSRPGLPLAAACGPAVLCGFCILNVSCSMAVVPSASSASATFLSAAHQAPRSSLSMSGVDTTPSLLPRPSLRPSGPSKPLRPSRNVVLLSLCGILLCQYQSHLPVSSSVSCLSHLPLLSPNIDSPLSPRLLLLLHPLLHPPLPLQRPHLQRPRHPPQPSVLPGRRRPP